MSMPIAAVVMSSPSRSSIRLNTYVSREKKNQKKGDRFVAQSGINGCVPEFAERQMRDNRKRWRKDGTRTVVRNGRTFVEGQYVQAYHVIQSFARDGAGALDPNNSDDWERAHEIGVATARMVAGKSRLATVTTQVDGATGCIHNHIVIDSIDKLTGLSFDSSNVKHSVLAKRHDALLNELGYVQQNTLDKGKEKIEKSELRALGLYQQWEVAQPGDGTLVTDEPFSVAVLKQRVRDALADETFTDFDSFATVARKCGVKAEKRGEKGRGITLTMLRREAGDGTMFRPAVPGDRRRSSKLGKDFMMDAVETAIQRNVTTQKQSSAVAAKKPVTPTPAASPARELHERDPHSTSVPHAENVVEPEFTHEVQLDAVPEAPYEQIPVEHQIPLSYAATTSEYRSQLRDVKLRDTKRQQLMLNLAAFDEATHDAFARGDRVRESDIPAGIGEIFVRNYGDKLDQGTEQLLRLREVEKKRLSDSYELAMKMPDGLRQKRLAAVKRGREQLAQSEYSWNGHQVELFKLRVQSSVKPLTARERALQSICEEQTREVANNIELGD